MKFLWIFLAVFSYSIMELSVLIPHDYLESEKETFFLFQSFDIELLSFEKIPESDPEFADFGTLRLRKLGQNQFVVDGDFEFKQTFADEIEVNLRFSDQYNY